MKLFVGLGNPGAKHARQRHNIGFMAVDAIAAEHGFGPWRAKFQGELSEGRLGGEKVLLLKPQTMMNLSGQSVGEAMRYLKIAPEDVTVFHDELDLAPGKLRIKRGGGHAGHNGLRSLHSHIGEAYARVRLGIGHPGQKHLVSGYVLHDFAAADSDWRDPLLDAVARAAPELAHDDDQGFMNAVAHRLQPTKAKAGDKTVTKAKKPGDETREEPEPGPLARLLAHFSRGS